MSALSIIELMDDHALVGDAYAGSSWQTWRVVLAAAHGLALNGEQLEIFRSVAGNREPPKRRVKELWCVVGRRGGKDSIAALIAEHAMLFAAESAKRRPGEKLTAMCIACDKSQAGIVLGYLKGLLRGSDLITPLITREDSETIEMENGIEAIVAPNSFRSIRGRTLCVAVLDEVAYFRSEDAATPDFEVFNALLPGLSTVKGAMLVGISSPYRRSGLLFEKWRDHFGHDDDDVLVVHGPTLTFNPTVDRKIIDDAVARDPAAASAEWLAQWRDDISGFLDAQWIDRAATLPAGELPPQAGQSYVAFLDPSGGRSDAMVCAIAHLDGEQVVVDAVRGRKAPFDPASVTVEFAELMHSYHCSQATSDRYSGEWVVSAFADRGITIKTAELSKSEIYLEAEPLFARGAITIPADRILLAELRNLERRTHRGGKDTVDHPFGGHDDYANAACGAAYLCAGTAVSGQRFVDFWTSSIACAAGDKAALAARAERVAAARARSGAHLAAAKSPPKTYVLRTPRPFANFCLMDGTRYSSQEEGLIRDVPEVHARHLIAAGCREVEVV
jgi:hypothetical protein